MFVLILPCFGHHFLSSHFRRARVDLPKKSPTANPASINETEPRAGFAESALTGSRAQKKPLPWLCQKRRGVGGFVVELTIIIIIVLVFLVFRFFLWSLARAPPGTENKGTFGGRRFFGWVVHLARSCDMWRLRHLQKGTLTRTENTWGSLHPPGNPRRRQRGRPSATSRRCSTSTRG